MFALKLDEYTMETHKAEEQLWASKLLTSKDLQNPKKIYKLNSRTKIQKNIVKFSSEFLYAWGRQLLGKVNKILITHTFLRSCFRRKYPSSTLRKSWDWFILWNVFGFIL